MYERGIWSDSGFLDHPAMTRTNGRAFNEWLRAQLKAKKMSQRQLAQQSGVDHSTISRLVRGDRMPSLGTATKLARGLRELGEDDDGPQYLGLMGGGVQNPTARVEYSLRADDALSEAQVRQVMEYYLAVRMRRIGSAFSNETNHVQRMDGGRVDTRSLAPANGPIVPRPALVAGGGGSGSSGGGRVAMDSRPQITPRLRQVRSTDRY
jgi:transcriptional regulator with XRE-family HTH domain